jgi:hypothetical protein
MEVTSTRSKLWAEFTRLGKRPEMRVSQFFTLSISLSLRAMRMKKNGKSLSQFLSQRTFGENQEGRARVPRIGGWSALGPVLGGLARGKGGLIVCAGYVHNPLETIRFFLKTTK